MKIGTVAIDQGRTLRDILRALDNRVTAQDNLAPDGTSGQVLMSNGTDEPPSWQDIPAVAPSSSGIDGTGVAGALAVWLDADTLSDSIVTQAGSLITVGGSIGVDVNAAITGTLAVTGAVDLDSTLDVAGNTALNGSVVLGDTSSDFITGSAILARNLLPEDAVWFLGNSTHRWSQVWVSGSLILKKNALAAGFYTGITFSSVSTGVTGWSIYALNTEVGDTGYDLYIQRSDSAGDFAWLTVTRDTGAWATVGDWTQTGTVNVSGAATLQSASLSINGLAYTWPGSQVANRVLRNTGPGTLAWSQVDLSTDVTGTLAGATVPAEFVSAGTFGASVGGGAYVFPSTLTVSGTLIEVGSDAGGLSSVIINAATATERSINFRTASVNRWRIVVNTATESGSDAGSNFALQARTDAGASIDSPISINRAAGGTMTFSRPVLMSSTATITSTLTHNGTTASLSQGASALTIVGSGTATSSEMRVRGAAATNREVSLYTDTTRRWAGRANVTAESGSDAGSNYDFIAYNDAGSQIDIVYRITRAANGSIAFASNRPITAGTYNGQTISSAASFTGTVAVTSTITAGAGVLINATLGSNGVNWQDAGVNRVIMRLDSSTSFSMNVRDGAGASIDNAWSLTLAAGGSLTIRRPITQDTGAAANLFTLGGNTSTASTLNINGAAATERRIDFRTASSLRSVLRLTSTAESGSDAGSNLEWLMRTDTGSAIDTWLTVTRALSPGTIAFNAARPITGGTYNGQTISSAANFTGTVTIGGTNLVLSNAAALITMGANAGTSSSILLNSAAGALNIIRFQAAGVNRWGLFTQGANEPLIVRAYDDAGTVIDNPLQITRAAGGTIAFASGRPITMGSSLAITGALSGVTTLALSGQLTSTLATGTAPFVVASTTKVANLNVDLLDDQTGSFYLDVANFTAGTFGAGNYTFPADLTVTDDLDVLGGPLTIGQAGTGGGANIIQRSITGTQLAHYFQTGSSNRWIFGKNSTAESGSDAGSAFFLDAHTDGGISIDTVLLVTRAAGGTIAFSSARPITAGTYNGQTISSSANFTGTLTVPRVISPRYGTATAVDVVLERNSVVQLTLGSLAATFAGTVSATQYTSSIATGTAPFVVASTTKVANLNVDLLDDQSGAFYLDNANATGTLDETLGGTGLSTYTLGDILYASAANTLSKLAGNTSTTPMYLRQTGSGAASAAPVWDALTAADVAPGTFSGGTFTFAAPVVHSSTSSFGADITLANSTITILMGAAASFMRLLGSQGAQTGGVQLSGNNAHTTGAYINLWGTSHANAGRLDIVSGGSAALTLTSASGQIECADDIDLASGQVLRVNGTQVVAAQGAAVADATGAGDVVAQLNAWLARARAHGLIAT